MNMKHMNEPNELSGLLLTTSGTSFEGPCECKGGQETSLALEGDVPDPVALEAQLDAFLQAQPSSGDDLEFASLDAELAEIDELGLASPGDEVLPSLQSILQIAEQYPGLKITFSF